MTFNLSNLINNLISSSQPNSNLSSNISVDLRLTIIQVADHTPLSRPTKRPFTRSLCKSLGIDPFGSSMVSPHSLGSSFDDSEFEYLSSGTPNRFFDGLQSSVIEDEFSDLLSSCSFPVQLFPISLVRPIVLLNRLPVKWPSTSVYLNLGLLSLKIVKVSLRWLI